MDSSLVEIQENASDVLVDYSTNLREAIFPFKPTREILRVIDFFSSMRSGEVMLKFRLFSVGKMDTFDSVQWELKKRGLRFIEPLEALVFAEGNPKSCSGFELLPALRIVESSCVGRVCLAFNLTGESISAVKVPHCDKIRPTWLIVAVPK